MKSPNFTLGFNAENWDLGKMMKFIEIGHSKLLLDVGLGKLKQNQQYPVYSFGNTHSCQGGRFSLSSRPMLRMGKWSLIMVKIEI